MSWQWSFSFSHKSRHEFQEPGLWQDWKDATQTRLHAVTSCVLFTHLHPQSFRLFKITLFLIDPHTHFVQFLLLFLCYKLNTCNIYSTIWLPKRICIGLLCTFHKPKMDYYGYCWLLCLPHCRSGSCVIPLTGPCIHHIIITFNQNPSRRRQLETYRPGRQTDTGKECVETNANTGNSSACTGNW
jgi:hypothetical protein